MLSACLIPVVFVGYSHSIQTSWHRSVNLDGPSAEVQTCRDGFGGRMAFSDQWVQVGLQYGYTMSLGEAWSVTVNLHGGYGGSDTASPRGVRQVTTLNIGGSVSVHHGRYALRLGVDHMSNGSGVNPANVGQDLVSIGLGVQFGR